MCDTRGPYAQKHGIRQLGLEMLLTLSSYNIVINIDKYIIFQCLWLFVQNFQATDAYKRSIYFQLLRRKSIEYKFWSHKISNFIAELKPLNLSLCDQGLCHNLFIKLIETY